MTGKLTVMSHPPQEVTWDTEDKAAVAEAERIFAENKTFMMAVAERETGELEQVFVFDETAKNIMLTTAQQGG